MRRLLVVSAVLAGLVFLRAAEAAEAVGEYVKDEKWGYKVRTPKEWTQVAMSASEQWIAAKHIAPRALAAKKTSGGYLERPEMWVIAFPKGREKGAKVELGTGEDSIEITIKNPYKDYKEFVKEMGLAGGGYHFSKEDPGEVDGQKVTMYEILVEKLVDSPLRILAWQFTADDVDFVVQIRILEDYYEDYKRTFDGVLKSFRRIPRTQAMPGQAAVTGKRIFEDESKMTPEQRAEHRKKEVEDTIQKEIAALPEGWINLRSEHYVALSHVDPKFTQQTLDFAEAIRGYLDKTFSIGSDYVPPGIIRIFANVGEERAYGQGSGGLLAFLMGGAEQIAVTRKSGEDKQVEFEWLARRVTGQWLSFRNRNLSRNMPFWIREGLQRHMAFARPAPGGKRIEFKPDPYDREALREMFKKGTAIPLRELLEGDEDKFKEHGHLLEAGCAVSWFLGEGGKGKLKNSVQAYLRELIAAVDEAEKEYKAKQAAKKGKSDGPEADSGPKTEEEEAAMMQAMQKEFEGKRKALRERAFKAAFGVMDDKDWKNLDAAFSKFAG